MTQEEKQLLLKDLCARLPYGVYVKFKQYNEPLCLSVKDALAICNGGEIISDLQYLYLRPMSSMTEEEEKELKSTLPFGISFSWDVNNEFIIYTDSEYDGDHYFSCFVDIQDWLNAHHFDYRGLIKKGLALKAPEDMYKEK